MKLKKTSFMGGFNRFRLMLTLGLAVLLPAAALIYVNFSQLRAFQRDKVLEAAFHRDFQDMLLITEKRINKKAYAMTEEVRDMFPSPDDDVHEKEKKLDLILSKSPWLDHVFLFDEKGFVLRSQPQQMSDKYFREEHDKMIETSHWMAMEGKKYVEDLQKKARSINLAAGKLKRSNGDVWIANAYFALPQVPKDRVVIGGAMFDPCYLQQTFFPGVLDEMVSQKSNSQGGNAMALMIYPPENDMGIKPLAATSGWGEGKPEVMRKFDDGFRPLALGIKYQGTSVAALGQTLVHRSFLVLGFLSLVIIGGLVLTRHVVSKEMALARLKSDFVSNVSHELRTPSRFDSSICRNVRVGSDHNSG